MGGERLVRRVYNLNVRKVRGRGRPRKCWLNEGREALAKKGLQILKSRIFMQARSEW